MTRETYVDFFDKKSNYFDFICGKIIRHPFFQIYGRYTGIETGYGFFGFNVRSTGFVINEYCGKTSNPEFNSFANCKQFYIPQTMMLSSEFFIYK